MKDFNPDDEKLTAFLRHYCPVPPKAPVNFEQQLEDAIAIAHPSPSPTCHFWVFPALFAAGMLLFSGGYGLLKSLPQIATDPDLEVFLVTAWNSSISEISPDSPTYTPVDDWLVLADSPSDFSFSQP
ncbi:MAG: hypothetical protein DSM107014_00425 [Gomphosphaeria aponina SAG 52.96 = DSM 107014]|uniref:Uncharacterized protein n=1 Tax=Gomphosphaeria aponina SAG 52.96 = DSM 107014 TaxID=1521640 RepID=A0A941GSR5_9CHRO|nr:hypothetical protein [Gomphosphaeria aponina SAG 52.96 = DSM 107014]